MLNFRNTNICMTLGLILVLIIDRLAGLPLYVYAALFVIYSSLLIYGSCFIGSNFYFKVFCSAKTSNREIAISFDDGPVPGNTAEILRILREQEIEAAFFCIGSQVGKNGALCRQMLDEGHVIGNHSYSHHFWFDLFASRKMLSDLRKMDNSLRLATGLTPRFFRPPYGVTNPNLKKAVYAGGYVPIGWNIRSMDTVVKNGEKLLEKASSRLKPGAIVLFHDTGSQTVSILEEFISRVKDQGYEIVRLDKLLKLEPYV
jgi:peptidoglycan/xylan/chitin deacetylase (PgdA/CDA1 family)